MDSSFGASVIGLDPVSERPGIRKHRLLKDVFDTSKLLRKPLPKAKSP